MASIVTRLLVGMLLSSICILVRADFTSATENYTAKKYAEALEEFKRLAALGYHEAQLNIGVMNFRGEGVDKNPVEAYAWVALAATNNNESYAHTRDLISAKLTPAQKDAAFKRLEELIAGYGDTAINQKLTPVLLSDVDCQFKLKPSKFQRPEFPEEALQKELVGTVDVDFTIDKLGYVRDYSVLVSTNKIFEKNTLDAVRKWRFEPMYVDGKLVEVVVQTIRMRFDIWGSRLNKKAINEYVEELRAKAQTGNPAQMYSFAYIGDLLKDLHIEKQESNSWYLKAAQAGVPQAQYQIGKSLVRGEGCQVDLQKGIGWLTLAAKENSADAQYFLGVSLLGSNEFQQNKQQGIDWLTHAALANHAKAKMRLAWILATDKDNTYHDPVKALALAQSVYESYPDKLRANETLAAAQAANGQFDDALKTQRLANDAAKDIKYPPELGQQRLAAYQNRQEWRE